MSKPQLKKATITVLDGADKGKVITVLFNPTEYSFERTNSYKADRRCRASARRCCSSSTARRISSAWSCSSTTTPIPKGRRRCCSRRSDPLSKRLDDISKLLEIDRDLHAPPPVRFNWGPMEFIAVIEKLGRKVTMFHPDGTPARATLSVTFKEYRTLRQQLEDPRRESADKTKRRVVVGSEALWCIAAREYDDPNEWVRIADGERPGRSARDRAGRLAASLPPIENPNGTRDTR